jgi:ADP-ribose pyrophosphatase YjhB (NUDIX family)
MTQGAFAAVLKDNQILLVKPPDWVSQFSGHWNFPGGVVDDGESLEEGAEREVFEETSVHCSVKKLLDSAYNEKFDTSICQGPQKKNTLCETFLNF